jgi:hypothetical protein
MSAMELQTPETWMSTPEDCEVVVGYDEQPSRDAALRLCHHLENNFKDDLDFAFTWWKFKYLLEPELARQASESAARADLIIISTHYDQELSPDIKNWIEEWLPRRKNPEGALTALTREARHPELWVSPLGLYLSSVGRRAQLDFISPHSLIKDDAWHNIRSREHQVTPLLDEILRRTHPVSHWGLNE